MSREHRKNLQRGLKQPLTTREHPFRESRHGKLQVVRGTRKERVMVAPGTPNAERAVEKYDPKLIYPAGTVITDAVAVVYYLNVDIPCWVPTSRDRERTQRVASGPTGTYGQKNVPPTRKKVAA